MQTSRTHGSSLALVGFTAVTAVAVVVGCGCGPQVVVYDVFGADQNPAQDALHTYASHAQVPMSVRSVSAFTSVDALKPKASGALTIDPATKVTVDSGVLKFAVTTGGAGEGTIAIVDAGGNVQATATVNVVDADAMELTVTAPATRGVTLPVVDTSKARIYAGGEAAFRTTLRHGADEIFGLEAVVAAPTDASVTTRNGIGCADNTCDAVRNAVDIRVPATTTAESDVALTAGKAQASVHVVPSTDADITDLVFDIAAVASGKGNVVAHVVAGVEPVFGVPVAWQVDGALLANQDGTSKTGDVLQFNVPVPNANPNVKPTTHDVKAAIAGQVAATSVVGDTFAVTSITAACGAAPSSTASVAVLALALWMWRRRTSARSRR